MKMNFYFKSLLSNFNSLSSDEIIGKISKYHVQTIENKQNDKKIRHSNL